MSVTAERLLSTQRRPAPHRFSTTKPGKLLKHQIPIRTFTQWDNDRPGFLEADLVAHCGGNVYGGYLYTLTLTDVATEWTECLPLLNRSPETVLVYIQDKKRLAMLIQAMRKACGGVFEPEQDYLEIHANISEIDKQAIEKAKDFVRVVFMTASASRGLSFKRAKHILIDIPHFAIEQNLMEILQVIYRGRGDETFDQQDKWLTFYLTDQIVYTDDENRELAVRERMLSLLNILLILKASMMTRIEGSGKLGVKQQFMMIPIGGKSVSAAGETFTSRISGLIKDLEGLSHRFWNDTSLSYVASSLRTILEHGRIRLITKQHAAKDQENELLRHSYLSVLPHFASDFFHAVSKGFDHLLTLPPLEIGHLAGGMLIVPVADKTMKEIYRTGLEEILKLQGSKHDLFADMEHLSRNQRYPESIRVAMRDAMNSRICLVEELLAQRGIVVSYETVRQWCLKFGQTYANELRRRRPRCGDKWHLDERYREHQRENALSLASSGSGWHRAGYLGTEPAEYKGC